MLDKTQTYRFTVQGREVAATVDPCSWMDPHYGLQVTIEADNCEGTVHVRSPVPFASATEADINALAQQVKLRTCRARGCNRLAFDMPESTNRDGYCEACFMARLDAKYSKSVLKSTNRNIKRLEKAYAAGHRFLAELWVHPEFGDDYLVELMSPKPISVSIIERELQKRHSTILTDYITTSIEEKIQMLVSSKIKKH